MSSSANGDGDEQPHILRRKTIIPPHNNNNNDEEHKGGNRNNKYHIPTTTDRDESKRRYRAYCCTCLWLSTLFGCCGAWKLFVGQRVDGTRRFGIIQTLVILIGIASILGILAALGAYLAQELTRQDPDESPLLANIMSAAMHLIGIFTKGTGISIVRTPIPEGAELGMGMQDHYGQQGTLAILDQMRQGAMPNTMGVSPWSFIPEFLHSVNQAPSDLYSLECVAKMPPQIGPILAMDYVATLPRGLLQDVLQRTVMPGKQFLIIATQTGHVYALSPFRKVYGGDAADVVYRTAIGADTNSLEAMRKVELLDISQNLYGIMGVTAGAGLLGMTVASNGGLYLCYTKPYEPPAGVTDEVVIETLLQSYSITVVVSKFTWSSQTNSWSEQSILEVDRRDVHGTGCQMHRQPTTGDVVVVNIGRDGDDILGRIIIIKNGQITSDTGPNVPYASQCSISNDIPPSLYCWDPACQCIVQIDNLTIQDKALQLMTTSLNNTSFGGAWCSMAALFARGFNAAVDFGCSARAVGNVYNTTTGQPLMILNLSNEWLGKRVSYMGATDDEGRQPLFAVVDLLRQRTFGQVELYRIAQLK